MKLLCNVDLIRAAPQIPRGLLHMLAFTYRLYVRGQIYANDRQVSPCECDGAEHDRSCGEHYCPAVHGLITAWLRHDNLRIIYEAGPTLL